MTNAENTALQTADVDIERRDRSPANLQRRSIYDIPMTITVSVGQKELSVAEVLKLGADTIVPLASHIDDPIDLVVNGKIIAKGELIEIENGLLGVKIMEIEESLDD